MFPNGYGIVELHTSLLSNEISPQTTLCLYDTSTVYKNPSAAKYNNPRGSINVNVNVNVNSRKNSK